MSLDPWPPFVSKVYLNYDEKRRGYSAKAVVIDELDIINDVRIWLQGPNSSTSFSLEPNGQPNVYEGFKKKDKYIPSYEFDVIRLTDGVGSKQSHFDFGAGDIEIIGSLALPEGIIVDDEGPVVPKVYLSYDPKRHGFNVKAVVIDDLSGVWMVQAGLKKANGGVTIPLKQNGQPNVYKGFYSLSENPNPGWKFDYKSVDGWYFSYVTADDIAGNRRSWESSDIEIIGSLSAPEKEVPGTGNIIINIGDNNTIGDININTGNGVINGGEWTGNVFFNLPSSAKISDIAEEWFGSTNTSESKAQILDVDSDPQLLDVATRTWSKKVKVNKIVQASNNGDTIRAEAPEKFVPAIGSVLNGGQARDIVEGRIGWDIIDGGDGSDFIHGGNGRDVITGGAGGDELWGDFGLNTFKSEKDGQKDLVVIKSDHYVYNWLNNSYTNNPNGERTDFIEGLDSWDRIRVTGGYKQDLRFAEHISHMGQTGIAIYLKDSLEALYTGNDLSLDQIRNMTDGDGSEAAIANSVHQYGLDWF